MSDILLIAADNSHVYSDQRNSISKLLPLDRIFYKSKIIDNINNSLVEININNTNHIIYDDKFNREYADTDDNRYSAQKIFLIRIPEKYLDPLFYGRKGIKKSYNARKLIVDKVNLFCDEEEIEMHFYSNKLLELYQIEFQDRLTSEIQSYEDSIFSGSNNRKKYYRKKYGNNEHGRKKSGNMCNNFKGDPVNLGKTLFRSLTLEIVDVVCNLKKIQLMQSEITIVGNKENKDDVLAMVWKLSQLAKYVTVVTSDEDTNWIENEAEEIFNNTGLAINISNNYKSVTINTEILINYGNIFELSAYKGLKRRTVIINNSLNDYSLGREKVRIRNPLINKVEVEFPKDSPHELKALAPEHFNTNQLAEIMLGSKNGWIEDKIGESFKKEGFRIKRLSGTNLDSII